MAKSPKTKRTVRVNYEFALPKVQKRNVRCVLFTPVEYHRLDISFLSLGVGGGCVVPMLLRTWRWQKASRLRDGGLTER